MCEGRYSIPDDITVNEFYGLATTKLVQAHINNYSYKCNLSLEIKEL